MRLKHVEQAYLEVINVNVAIVDIQKSVTTAVEIGIVQNVKQ